LDLSRNRALCSLGLLLGHGEQTVGHFERYTHRTTPTGGSSLLPPWGAAASCASGSIKVSRVFPENKDGFHWISSCSVPARQPREHRPAPAASSRQPGGPRERGGACRRGARRRRTVRPSPVPSRSSTAARPPDRWRCSSRPASQSPSRRR